MQILPSITVVARGPSDAAIVGRDGVDTGAPDATDPAGDAAAFGALLTQRIGLGALPGEPAEIATTAVTPTAADPVPGTVASIRGAGREPGDAGDSDDASELAGQLAAQFSAIAQWVALGQPVSAASGTVPASAGQAVAPPGTTVDAAVDRGATRTASTAVEAATTAALPVTDAASAALPDFAAEVANATTSAGPLAPSAPGTRADANAPRTIARRTDGVAPMIGTEASGSVPPAISAAPAARGGDALAAATIPVALEAGGSTGSTNIALSLHPSAGSTLMVAEASSSPLADRLQAQVGTPAWSNEVGQAVLRIATTDLQTASLRLNPEHLGPLDVQVRVDQGVAHVAFQSAHADTRQALEASRTTLDQLFQGQGLRTGDVSIGTSSDTARPGTSGFDGTGDTARRDDGGTRRGFDNHRGRDDAAGTTVGLRVRKASGLVDTFA